jgi:hypothetical protein
MEDPRFSKKARNAILQYAIFRWENAVVLAGTILLTAFFPEPFPWWPIWGWPLLGLLGIAAIVYTSLINTENNARLLLQAFQEQFNLRRIRSPELRKDVQSALVYQQRIAGQVQRQDADLVWERPEDTARQLKDWISNVYELALRLDAYRADNLLSMQRETVPQEIEELRTRRRRETDPVFQKELDGLLESKQRQLDSLLSLETRMRQAELQIEQSLAALATVDSQLKLIEAKDVDSSRTRRLREDIREQVNRLNDLVASINDVYDYNKPGIG